MASHDILHEPVAIIGIACEYPGDIHSPTDFWHTLEQGRDVGSMIPRDRTDISSYFAHMFNKDNDGQLRKQLFQRGYFLSASQWDTFEPSFFGLTNEAAASIDPCHRLLMLKFVHLLDDAGYTVEKIQGSRTSVHIAQLSMDHAVITFRMRPEHLSRFQGANTLRYNAPSRLSYHFNLQGPNLSIDIACASSLEAVHLALQTLRTGEADMAVCGGVNSMYTPENCMHGSTMGAISPDGRSRSFSLDANGYAKGKSQLFKIFL
jgi:acyl transferase domain-containing protein